MAVSGITFWPSKRPFVITIPPVPKVVSRLPAVWATPNPPAQPIREATTLADPSVLVAVRSICRPVLVVFNISNIITLLEFVSTLLLTVKCDPLRR